MIFTSSIIATIGLVAFQQTSGSSRPAFNDINLGDAMYWPWVVSQVNETGSTWIDPRDGKASRLTRTSLVQYRVLVRFISPTSEKRIEWVTRPWCLMPFGFFFDADRMAPHYAKLNNPIYENLDANGYHFLRTEQKNRVNYELAAIVANDPGISKTIFLHGTVLTDDFRTDMGANQVSTVFWTDQNSKPEYALVTVSTFSCQAAPAFKLITKGTGPTFGPRDTVTITRTLASPGETPFVADDTQTIERLCGSPEELQRLMGMTVGEERDYSTSGTTDKVKLKSIKRGT